MYNLFMFDSILTPTKTPLHWAAVSGHANVVTFLLDRGAKIDAKSLSGEVSHLVTPPLLLLAEGLLHTTIDASFGSLVSWTSRDREYHTVA